MWKRIVQCALFILLSFTPTVAFADQATIEAKVKAILDKHCTACHNSKKDPSGIGVITNLKGLIAKGKVKPGKPEASRILIRVLRDIDKRPMPPEFGDEGEELARLKKDETETIRQWIVDLSPNIAKKEKGFDPQTDTTIFKMYEHLVEDLKSLKPEDRKFARYFTYYEKVVQKRPKEEIDELLEALGKILNSVSWGKRIVLPKPVANREAHMVRIDLRDYQLETKTAPNPIVEGWTATRWYRISNFYPYYFRTLENTRIGNLEREIYKLTGVSNDIYLRADWFVANLMHPMLYRIALLGEKGVDLHSIARRLGWETYSKLEKTAIRYSGEAIYNRVIHRTPTKYGAFWKTEDFRALDKSNNVFKDPLSEASTFSQAIFHLPNGLYGYALAKGVDSVPPEIIHHPSFKKGILNFHSCIQCHQLGVLPREDELAKFIRLGSLSNYSESQIAHVEKYYKDTTEVAEADNLRFQKALSQVDKSGTGYNQLFKVSKRYGARLSREDFLNEFNHYRSAPPEYHQRRESIDKIGQSIDHYMPTGATRQYIHREHHWFLHLINLKERKTSDSERSLFALEFLLDQTYSLKTWVEAVQTCHPRQIPSMEQLKSIPGYESMSRDLFVEDGKVWARIVRKLPRPEGSKEKKATYEESKIRVCAKIETGFRCLNFDESEKVSSLNLYRAAILLPTDHFSTFKRGAFGRGFSIEYLEKASVKDLKQFRLMCVTLSNS